MMKKNIFGIMCSVVLLVGGLTGCYDDKGNYGYSDINDMTVTITAQNQAGKAIEIDEYGSSRLKQASGDTIVLIYTPTVSQTLSTDENNLEFLWEVSSNVWDTIRKVTTKTLNLSFYPLQNTTYSVTFCVTDVTTNISYYKRLSALTVQPYINSWFVLNEKDKSCRISAIEELDSENCVITEDAYADMGNAPRFQDATDLIYSYDFTSFYSSPEMLQILTPDSLFMVYPFDMKVQKSNAEVLPSQITDNKTKLLYGVDGNVTFMLDANNRLYYASRQTDGKYIECQSKEVPNYRVDCIGRLMPESRYICFWDGDLRQFMYVNEYGDVNPFKDDQDWKEKKVLWMGYDNKKADDKNAMGVALVENEKNGSYWLYRFTADGYKIVGEELNNLFLDNGSQFVNSAAIFADQFFYSVGSKLYRFIIANHESVELYDAGAPITGLKFRLDRKHSRGEELTLPYRALGVIVEKENEGQLHEVILSPGGDFESVKVFDGFGQIKDICFTFVNRVI